MACNTSSCIINSLLSLFSFISFPIYVSVIIVLIAKRKQLKSSFFKICISLGFADLGYLTMKFIFRRMPPLLWKYWPSWHPLISSIGFQTASAILNGWSIYYAQVFGVVILSINRLTAYCWPTKYKGIWNSKTLIYATTLQWFWVLPFSLPQLHPICHSRLNMIDNNTIMPKFINDECKTVIWNADAVLEGAILQPLLVIIHIVLLVVVIGMKMKVSPVESQNEQRNEKMELRFALIGSVLCGCYVFLATNYTFWIFFDTPFVSMLAFSVVQTIFTVSNPFLLFALSSKFRTAYLQFYIPSYNTTEVGNKITTNANANGKKSAGYRGGLKSKF